MHNHDDKYLARPGFEPGTSRLQAPVDTNEPSGPACKSRTVNHKLPIETLSGLSMMTCNMSNKLLSNQSVNAEHLSLITIVFNLTL